MELAVSKEVWKPVPGFEGYYEVSNLGRVRSVEREMIQILKIPAKILRPRPPSSGGSASVLLRKDGKSLSTSIRQLVLKAFVGDPPEPGAHAKLIDPDKPATLENLTW